MPSGRLPLQQNYDPSGLRMQNASYSHPRPDRPPSSQGMNSSPGSQEPNHSYPPGQMPPGDRKMYVQRTDSMVRLQQPMGMNMMRPPESKGPVPMVRPGEEGHDLPRAYVATRPPGVRGMPNMPGSPQASMRSNNLQMSMDGRTTPVDNRPPSSGMPPRPVMRQMTPSQYPGSPQQIRHPNFSGSKDDPNYGHPDSHDNKLDSSRQSPFSTRPPSRASDSGHAMSESPDHGHPDHDAITEGHAQPETVHPKPILMKRESKLDIAAHDDSAVDPKQSPDNKPTRPEHKIDERSSSNDNRVSSPSVNVSSKNGREPNGDASLGHHVKFPPDVEKVRVEPGGGPKGDLPAQAKRPTSLNQGKIR